MASDGGSGGAAAAAWVPSDAGLSAVCRMLHEYNTPGANQAQVYEQLEAARRYPDFNNYLAHVLCCATNQPTESRQVRQRMGPFPRHRTSHGCAIHLASSLLSADVPAMRPLALLARTDACSLACARVQAAGLLLKNNCRGSWRALEPQVCAYVQACIIALLAGAEAPAALRRTASSVAAAIAIHCAGGFGASNERIPWPELPAAVFAAIDSGVPEVALGALNCVQQVCEDSPALWTMPSAQGTAPLAELLPRLLRVIEGGAGALSTEVLAQRYALGALNEMIAHGSGHAQSPAADVMAAHHEAYLRGVVGLRQSPDSEVRGLVSAGLTQLVTLAPHVLEPHMSDVIEIMLLASQDGDESVALESSEFWAAFCEAEVESAVLWRVAPRLVPVLLKNMAYADDDDDLIAAEAEEAGTGRTGNEASELKPFHAGGRAKGFGEAGAQGAGGMPDMPGWGDGTDGGEHEEFEGSDDDFDGIGEWNLRKSSASSLDVLSTTFRGQLLPLLMPALEARMADPDWRAQEACILTLGAIAEGCGDAIEQYLPTIIPYVLSKLEHQKILVRSISAWTLSRYAKWLATEAPGVSAEVKAAQQQKALAARKTKPTPVPDGLLDASMQALLSHLGDTGRRVQEAACSALALMCEAFDDALLARYSPAMAVGIAHAAPRYSRRSMRTLYDLVGTMGEACGLGMTEEVARQLLEPFAKRLDDTPDTDDELLPLLECLAGLASALRDRFRPAAQATFARAAAIARNHARLREVGGDAAYQTQDFAVAALDLMSGVVEGLGPSAEPLVAASCPAELLLASCADPSGDVRQSAFALLGDVAKACAPHVATRAPELLSLCVATMRPELLAGGLGAVSVCNNACWAAGEMCVRAQQLGSDALLSAAPQVAAAAATLLLAVNHHKDTYRHLGENCGITLGRCALVAAEHIAPHAGGFCVQWCRVLGTLRDDVEKRQGFAGLCAAMQHSPQAFVSCVEAFCVACASWTSEGKLERCVVPFVALSHPFCVRAHPRTGARKNADQSARATLCWRSRAQAAMGGRACNAGWLQTAHGRGVVGDSYGNSGAAVRPEARGAVPARVTRARPLTRASRGRGRRCCRRK